MCPLSALCYVWGVLGHLAPVNRCARSVRCVAYAASWATWLLFTVVPTRCVVLLVRLPGPLGTCLPLCSLGAVCSACRVLGPLAPVHGCAHSLCSVACAVTSTTWPLSTGVPPRCAVFCVQCPGPLGSCSPVCPLRALWCVCGVRGPLAPIHRCARWERCVACAMSCTTWFLFTDVLTWSAVLLVRCPGPLGLSSPSCFFGELCCVCGVLDYLAPVHRRARPVRSVVCAVSWVTWLLFNGVSAGCDVLRVRSPGPLGSCSPVCSFVALCCVCGVLDRMAPVYRCARPWCCGVVLCLRCPGPLGTCLRVCSLGALCSVCSVLGPLAPGQRSAHSVCCVAVAVNWTTSLLLTSVPARGVVVLRCVCPVRGHLAAVHRCARFVRCVSVQCPGLLGSCSTVWPLGVLCCLCGYLCHLASFDRCARSVRCVMCGASRATWLLLTCVLVRCVVLRMQRPGPLGSCSLVCPLDALCCVCSVLGHLAPVHRCACSLRCVECALS